MAVYLKRYGFAITKYDTRDTGISGSARFQPIVSWLDKELHMKVKKIVRKDELKESSDKVSGGKRVYAVNRKKLLDRLNAYVCLRKARKFLAFYSISFPAGMADDISFKLWNSCLTSLREKLGLKSYIWVMERQSNGTVHFHMLTIDYMPVRGVNSVVANCIDYYVSKGLASWGRSSVSKYNGVDVENISKRARKHDGKFNDTAYRMCVHYVTKYMSKNSEKEAHRQWHCSRLVSALFVTAYLSHEEVGILFEGEEHLFKSKKVIHSEFAELVLFSVIDSTAWRDTIGGYNEKVYEYFERSGCW